MLGVIGIEGRGECDRLIAAVAGRLTGMGWPLAGVIQVNTVFDPGRPCHMDLLVLDGTAQVRISQDLGPMARGCRLDAGGLAQAAGLVEAALAAGPRLLIVNKFGKEEAEGRGFRPVIGEALARDVPVLTAVGPRNRPAFDAFAQGLAEDLPPDADAVIRWCEGMAC
ncbi:MAG: DUF2478 domain-containing protein [Gemmobacter sp.]